MNAKNLTAKSFEPLHDLRHTCATLLLKRGVHPRIVQELLGHSGISITLDTWRWAGRLPAALRGMGYGASLSQIEFVADS